MCFTAKLWKGGGTEEKEETRKEKSEGREKGKGKEGGRDRERKYSKSIVMLTSVSESKSV